MGSQIEAEGIAIWGCCPACLTAAIAPITSNHSSIRPHPHHHINQDLRILIALRPMQFMACAGCFAECATAAYAEHGTYAASRLVNDELRLSGFTFRNWGLSAQHSRVYNIEFEILVLS